MGRGFAICRQSPAPVVGHVGWAIERRDGTLFAGATERFQRKGDPGYTSVRPGDNNDAWTATFPNLTAMLEAFAGTYPNGHPRYHWWKAYEVASPNFDAAVHEGERNKSKGWDALNNNCLDHVGAVLEKYGVPEETGSDILTRACPGNRRPWLPSSGFTNGRYRSSHSVQRTHWISTWPRTPGKSKQPVGP